MEIDDIRDDDEDRESFQYKPCLACPDGYVWNANGPTAKTCPVCKGHAALNLNGSPLSQED